MKVLHVFTLAATVESFFDGQFRFLVDKCGHEIHLACSSSKTITEFADRNRIKYFDINVSRTISPRQDLKTVRQLLSLIRKEKYDVVVGHTPKGALLSMLASKVSRTKNRVYLRHGLIYTTALGKKRSILKLEEKFVSALATKIINISPSVAELAVKDKLNKDKKQVLLGRGSCGGIDCHNIFNPTLINDKVALIDKYRLTGNEFTIGFVGRLCKDKGIPELLEGFNLFKSKHPEINVKLILVGGYDTRDVLSDDIKEEIYQNTDIIDVGVVSKNDIAGYYGLMDLFVFPSHREGLGMSVIEASAMQLPILVARSHGCVDTIIEHSTGEYIDLTPQSIAEGIEYFIDKSKRKEYGIRAREFAANNFDHTVLWPKIAEFYDSLS